ncbi:hypothetical protein UVI_02001480 [Ustilaginoidea virens]|uniref:Disintegrin and metalloproteinase domain-containing protein B n=1 Tax=Ustilaginoidea virens TaxID=1159556 RepID=A0A1B5KTG7_USTVR|nr:hypothetical protein UVI_02001480 [Ustilaginoidea virens]
MSKFEEAVIHTPSHRAHAFSSFDLTFTLHNGQQRIRLALEPNHDVLHQDFAITHLNENGSVREVNRVPRSEDRVYRGDAFIERQGIDGWSKAGWARLSIHRDGPHPQFDGAFRIDGDNHHIIPRSEYQAMKDDRDPAVHPSAAADAMIVWRDSDVADDDEHNAELKRDTAGTSRCSADSLEFNGNLGLQAEDDGRSSGYRSLFGRQIDDGGGGGTGLNLLDSIGSTTGCPTTKKIALVGVATDCNYFSAFNSTDAVKKQIISIVNKASEIYERTFKISLAIKNLTVIDRGCTGTAPASTPWNVKCSDNVTINDRLNSFSKWRGESRDENAYWTLFTTCASQTAVGLAWRGMLCRSASGPSGDRDSSGTNDTVAATNIVVRADTEWQIFAHESGHTFGAVHDCVPETCPAAASSQACCPLSKSHCDAGGKYLMNPSTSKGVTDFSPCSMGNICAGLRSNMVKGNCLTDNKNVETSADIGSRCGNGIVEAGEDCDCGGEAGCGGNRCCDAKTCKFAANAQCDPGNEDCCTEQCRFAPSGAVCRPSMGECDVAETCPGDRAACPEDKHKSDGEACGGGGGDGDGRKCASGQCTSRDLQCQHMASSLTGRNNTQACPDASDCSLSCSWPGLPPNQCVRYNQNFADGTGCGAGGRCAAGQCQGSSTWQEIGQWIANHKAIFIPVAVVAGCLVAVALASCACGLARRCARRRRRRRSPTPGAPDMLSTGWPAPAASSGGLVPHPGHGGYPPGYPPVYPPGPPPLARGPHSARYA